MKWESLEHKIKAAFFGQQAEVDVDAIWAAIEPEVDAINRRRKRRGFVWFWLAGLLLLGGAFAYFYQKAATTQHELPQRTAAVAQSSEPKTEEQFMQDSNGSLEETPQTSEAKATVNTKGDVPASPKSEPLPRKLSGILGNKKVNPSKQSGSSPMPIHQHINEQGTMVNAPIAEQKKPVALTPVSEIPTSNEKAESLHLAAMLPTLPLALFDREIGHSFVKEVAYVPTENLSAMHQQPFSYAANVQGSLSFVEKKLAAKDSLSNSLLPLRNKTERELEAFQVGLGFTVLHRSGFGLSSGLNYTQINERFRFNQAISSIDTVYGIKYLVVNLDNDTIPIYGDVPHEKKTTYQKEYYNKYRMFDIPVLLGYHHKGRNYSIGVQAGVFVNLSLSAQGQIMQSATEFTNIGTAGVFRSNIGMSYYLGLSAGRFINKNLEAYISPFMRHYPKDFAKESYGIRQRYNLYGVNMGMRYFF